jgi:hypothetical protein
MFRRRIKLLGSSYGLSFFDGAVLWSWYGNEEEEECCSYSMTSRAFMSLVNKPQILKDLYKLHCFIRLPGITREPSQYRHGNVFLRTSSTLYIHSIFGNNISNVLRLTYSAGIQYIRGHKYHEMTILISVRSIRSPSYYVHIIADQRRKEKVARSHNLR